MHIRQNFDDIVYLRGIEEVVFLAYEQRQKVGRSIFNVIESTQAREDSTTVGGIGTFDVKPEGEAINYDDLNAGFRETFTHVNYAKGFRTTEEMMDDELYGVMEDQATELGNGASASEETILANHFNNGFATTGYDGVALFSASHLQENGDTWSNAPSTHGDLSQTTLEQGLIDFRDQRDGGGKRLQIKPEYLVVPADLIFTASKLLNSTSNPTPGDGVYNGGTYAANTFGDGATNEIHGLGLSLVPWDYLTTSTHWFLIAEKANHRLTCYERKAFNTDYTHDFDTGDYKIKGSFRQSSGWKDAHGTYGNDGVA